MYLVIAFMGKKDKLVPQETIQKTENLYNKLPINYILMVLIRFSVFPSFCFFFIYAAHIVGWRPSIIIRHSKPLASANDVVYHSDAQNLIGSIKRWQRWNENRNSYIDTLPEKKINIHEIYVKNNKHEVKKSFDVCVAFE